MPAREGLGLPRSQRLSFSGSLAELHLDDLTEDGVVLSIGGAEQSHVEVGDPGFLLHDYLIRMAAVLQTCARERLSARGAHQAPQILHLGAGALTLPRWLEHHFPEVEQTVLDIEPELVEFVLEHLPMRTLPHNLIADAAAAIAPGGVLAGRTFDVVVVDLFNSAEAPAQLTSTQFHARAFEQVAPGGLLLMNLGDEPPMDFVRAQVASLLEASAGLGTSNDSALLSAPTDVLEARAEGNLTFAARRSAPLEQTELNAIWAAGPHPGDVLSGEELHQWAQQATRGFPRRTSH
ncbi:spermidine synthase [Nesterenkonia halotolerans]|uniref:Spermidine synthase n=1 Tax=Nesterenkonia halotolerans TaxID=225325 RepID=A0ABR9J4J8_9MICC|nr:fused MFS/spermidine synthase [Nesterenkonia halotolerans]MBE1513894.1 hypothetical protein [Nesterenkonia halotolerans]